MAHCLGFFYKNGNFFSNNQNRQAVLE